jgi:dUTP pyrophosphatase
MFSVTCSNLKSICLPQKEGDVGFDLVATSEPKIVGERVGDSPYYASIDYIEYETNLQIEPPDGWFGLVFPRSSVSNKNLQLCNSVGVIDNGFRGCLKVRFNYLAQPKHLMIHKYIDGNYIHENFVTEVDMKKIYKKGERVAQLVFFQSLVPELVEGQVSKTQRNFSGFGSTN